MQRLRVKGYRDDLAYIHDVGHGDFARRAAPSLLRMLRGQGILSGLVVDLGCGSGIWARELCTAGYDVLGIDISNAMLAIARKRLPHAKFRLESFFASKIPPCVAVTAIGECFSYAFDKKSTLSGLRQLFRRIHASLEHDGLLIFDVAARGRVPASGSQRNYREGQDWAVLVTAHEDKGRHLLTRRITSFRKVGDLYRRDFELHRLRLLNPLDVAGQLREVGFRVRILTGYGRLRFAPGHIGFLARKP